MCQSLPVRMRRLLPVLLLGVALLPSAAGAKSYVLPRADVTVTVAPDSSLLVEEKILFAAAKTARGGEPVPEFARLRADHARLTALLVPTPTPEIVAQIRAVLAPHNELEERGEGTYAVCMEAIAAADAEEIFERIRAAPEPPVRPYYDVRKPIILQDE